MVCVDVTLSGLKDQLNKINGRLNHEDAIMMDNVKYHHMSIDSDGHVQFTLMKLQGDDDVITMFFAFGQYS